MNVTPSNDGSISPGRGVHLGRKSRRWQDGALLGAVLGSMGLCLGVGCTLITDVDREKIPVTERPPFPEVDAGHFDAGGENPEPGDDVSDAGSDAAPGDAEDAASPGPADGADATSDAAATDAA
jgi:hypothetical protein